MPTGFGGWGPEPRQAPQSTGELPCIPSLFFPVMFHCHVLTSNLFLPWGQMVGWLWTLARFFSLGLRKGRIGLGVCCIHDPVYLQGVHAEHCTQLEDRRPLSKA